MGVKHRQPAQDSRVRPLLAGENDWRPMERLDRRRCQTAAPAPYRPRQRRYARDRRLPRATYAPTPARAAARRATPADTQSAASASSIARSCFRASGRVRASRPLLSWPMGRNPDQHCGAGRRHAAGGAPADARGDARGGERRRAVREARGVQPGRQRQGPHRRGDDRGGRGRRAVSSRAARRSSRRRAATPASRSRSCAPPRATSWC